MKRFLIYLCLGLIPALSSAQNVIVKAELDSMMMWVGQQTGLHVEVACDAGQEVTFPAYRDTIVRGLEILPPVTTDTQYVNDGQRMLVTRNYTLTCFDSTLIYIPYIPVTVDGEEYQSNRLALAFMSYDIPEENAKQIFGPKENMNTPVKFYEVKEIPLPFHPVVGNHDITNNGWALWTNMFHSSFYMGYVYVENDGFDYFDRLIFLDSASGTLGEEQIDEIESHFFEADFPYMDKIKLRHTFVFGHTNIFRPSASEFASTFTREETYYLLDKFDHWNTSIVFSGHVHDWDERKVGDITYLTLDTMCEKNRPEPGDYLVRVHVKRDGSLSWERVHMSYAP